MSNEDTKRLDNTYPTPHYPSTVDETKGLRDANYWKKIGATAEHEYMDRQLQAQQSLLSKMAEALKETEKHISGDWIHVEKFNLRKDITALLQEYETNK